MPMYSIATTVAANTPMRAGTWSTPVSVAASITAVALLPANANRLGLTITNTSKAFLYIRCAAVATPATATSYDRVVPPESVLEWTENEIPTTALNGIWVGTITGGTAVISESAP